MAKRELQGRWSLPTALLLPALGYATAVCSPAAPSVPGNDGRHHYNHQQGKWNLRKRNCSGVFCWCNNDQIVFLNPATDPYTNGNTTAMMDENQITTNNIIGQQTDIGRVWAQAAITVLRSSERYAVHLTKQKLSAACLIPPAMCLMWAGWRIILHILGCSLIHTMVTIQAAQEGPGNIGFEPGQWHHNYVGSGKLRAG